ncbi:MAG: hypothetical protein KA777_03575 [Rhodoferax sp.]|nr:hypothetical protein [Rhodoferax sp.]MBP8135337.1 hypothetical protein [Rhodoferax sp.]
MRHLFPFDRAEIEIQLPACKEVDRDNRHDQVAGVTSWSADGQPIKYEIYKVDVIVRLKQCIPLPAKVLDVTANAFELISEQQQRELEDISKEHGRLAESAIEYWLSVLRWKTDDYRISRPYFASGQGDWNVRLFDDTSQKKVWVQSSTAHAGGFHRVTHDEWLDTETHLTHKNSVPIYISLKHDAAKFLAIGDYRRSIIDLAVSCETFLRNTVLGTLPAQLNPALRSFIEEVNINRFVTNFLPSALKNDAAELYKKQLQPELVLLFKTRNKVMHQANNIAANAEDCAGFLGVLNKLFTFVPSNLK